MDRRRAARWAVVSLGALTLAGALLRVWQIGTKSLWIDEAFSVWVARQPLAVGVSWLARIDQHPPLYYALLHLWLRLGDGPAAVRLLSALASVLSIPVLCALGTRLAGRKVGLLGAAVLAFSPFHVYLAQEARMYALLGLLVSLSLWALAWLLGGMRLPGSRRPVGASRNTVSQEELVGAPREAPLQAVVQGRRRPATDRALRVVLPRLCAMRIAAMERARLAWAAYVVATAAALWTHNTAVLYWIAANAIVLGLWVVGRVGRDGRAWAGVPGPRRRRHGGAADADVPGPRAGGRREAGSMGALVAPPLRAWALAQGAVLVLWAPWLPDFVRQSRAVYERFWLPAPTWHTVSQAVEDFLCAFLPQRISWTPAIWTGYGALLVLGLWALRRQRGRPWFLLAAFLAPVGGAWLISVGRPIFYDRTLIWATVPLYLLLAAGIAALRYRPYVVVATTMLATLSLLSLREYYSSYQKEAWDEAAAYVAAQAEAGDLVLYHATWTQLPFDYYFQEYGLPVEERGVPADLFARGVLEPQMTAADVPALQELVAGRERVWLVYSHQWYTDPQGLVPQVLGEALALRERRRFYGLEVRLYGRAGR